MYDIIYLLTGVNIIINHYIGRRRKENRWSISFVLGFSDVITLEKKLLLSIALTASTNDSVAILMWLKVLQYSDPRVFRFAYPAFQESLAFVCIEMLFLIRNLIELFMTSVHWAWEGLLRGVYSKMIEEIVPFSEEFPAIALVTGEDTSQTSC
jgi:hypothetical protein